MRFIGVTKQMLLVLTAVILWVSGVGHNVSATPNEGGGQSTGCSILVYLTTITDTYDSTACDSILPMILQSHGHTVTVTDRKGTSVITPLLLDDYDQLWFLSTYPAAVAQLAQPEIDAILDFRNQGNGLLIMADNESPDNYVDDANQISIPLGVTFHGTGDHGHGEVLTPIAPDFADHPLAAGVDTIPGNRNEAKMTVGNDVEVVATYQGDTLIAALDDGYGRVVFDVSFLRVFDGSIPIGDNEQYVTNIADWLCADENDIPTLTEWGLIIFGVVLLGFITWVFLRRRKAAVSLR